MPYLAVPDFITTRATWLVWLCGLASLTAPVSRFLPTGQFENVHWMLEMAAHWQWVYLVMGMICLALLLAVKRAWWPIIPAVMLGSAFMVQSAPLERGVAPASNESVLTVGTANLNFDTKDFTPLTRWLLSEEAPDVVFLQEFTDWAQRAMSNPEVLIRYPHRLEAPQPDQFGLAVLSRHPLVDGQTLESEDMRATLRLRARLTWRGKTIHLSAVHPMPPLDAAYAQIRDRTLIQEAEYLVQAGGLALMAGDFNTTPWTRGMFALDSRMRRANDVSVSWPNVFGWLSVLPLDHVLASHGWQLFGSHLGPDLGSDHRPVVVKLVAN